ncbi:MAG: hypothetical protein N0E48_10940, partial [Candidatus Thiodiazotropha endolucinida]|nr:hypothetical protein [Candidatus Thiodiazotropha endolucinida]
MARTVFGGVLPLCHSFEGSRHISIPRAARGQITDEWANYFKELYTPTVSTKFAKNINAIYQTV